MLYTAADGMKKVEIATLVEHEDGVHLKVDNLEDLKLLLVDSMGYSNQKDFEDKTGVKITELVGKFFSVYRDRVFLT